MAKPSSTPNTIKYIIDALKQYDSEPIELSEKFELDKYYFYCMKDNNSEEYYLLELFKGNYTNDVEFYSNALFYKINGNFNFDTMIQLFFNFCENFVKNDFSTNINKSMCSNYLKMSIRSIIYSNIMIYETSNIFTDSDNFLILDKNNLSEYNNYINFNNSIESNDIEEKNVFMKLTNG